MESSLMALGSIVGFYFFFASLSYLGLLGLGWSRIHKRREEIEQLPARAKKLTAAEGCPRVTIIVPAHNEEVVIGTSVETFLKSDYPAYEVLVVDDGSSDSTAAKLIERFRMRPVSLIRKHKLSKAEIHETYESSHDPKLRLIRQKRRGKSGALNTGIDYASGELVCTADADTILEEDALIRLVVAYRENPADTLGVSGTVRVLNGADYHSGAQIRGHLPKDLLSLWQIVEYIRSFYCGRMGWEQLDATVLMSGAFSLFRTTALVEVGGFDERSITEDFEIVVRMRKYFSAKGMKPVFRVLPDPICWTQVPTSLSALRAQRIRWQRGLVETLIANRELFFSRRHGRVAWTVFPYLVFFEWVGPFVELVGLALVSYGIYSGTIPFSALAGVFGIGILLSLGTTLVGIHLEEKNYARHHSKKDLFPFVMAAVLENFGFRPLTWFWRLEAMVRMPFEKKHWGGHERSKLETSHRAAESRAEKDRAA